MSYIHPSLKRFIIRRSYKISITILFNIVSCVSNFIHNKNKNINKNKLIGFKPNLTP